MAAGSGAKKRFFFSVRAGSRALPDREGIELGPNVDLSACARYLAERLRSDGSLPGTALDDCVVEVTDSDGSLLVTERVPAS